MTGQRSRHEPGNLGAKPRDGIEAQTRAVVGGQGGVRQRAGMIAVAAVAILVVAAGIGLAGGKDSPPDASASDAAGSGSPAASGETPSEPTKQPSARCGPVDPASLPEFRLGSSRGNGDPVQGVGRATAPDQPDASSPTGLAWPTPAESPVLALSYMASIVLVPDGDACVRSALVEFLPEHALDRAPLTLGDGELSVSPPRNKVVLGSLPAGAWIVRVVAQYSTGSVETEDLTVIERFFRVAVEDPPEVPPEVTPAVPCPTVDAGAAVPNLSLLAGDGVPVPGVNLATYPGDVLRNGALVEGTFPDRLLLLVDGEVCATAWTIQWLDYTNGNVANEYSQPNQDQNPHRVSQNRIELLGGVMGKSVIMATLEFGPGRTARAAWEVTMTGPAPPVVTVVGPQGQAVNAVRGCGAGWSADDGAQSAYEPCSDYSIPAGVQLITLRSGEALRADLVGATVQGWNVSCGIRGGQNGREFQSGAGCDLGGAEHGPVMFLPFDGTSIVQIQVSTLQDGVLTYAGYFVDVLVEP